MSSPIRPMHFDSAEFLVLAFVAVAMMIFFMWQIGLWGSFSSVVLGASTMR